MEVQTVCGCLCMYHVFFFFIIVGPFSVYIVRLWGPLLLLGTNPGPHEVKWLFWVWG